MSDPIETLQSFVESMQKALTASTAASLSTSTERKNASPDFSHSSDITHVEVVGSRGNYGNNFEPIITPTVLINPKPVLRKSEAYETCICGCIKKSSGCSRCAAAASICEAKPYHRR